MSIGSFTTQFPVDDNIAAITNTVTNRNYWLRRWLGMIRVIRCLVECRHTITSVIKTVTGSGRVLVRQADPLAVKTIVTNTNGDTNAWVFENGKRVRYLEDKSSVEIPMSGKKEIHVQLDGVSDGENITVTTYQRCLCGDPAPPPQPDDPFQDYADYTVDSL